MEEAVRLANVPRPLEKRPRFLTVPGGEKTLPDAVDGFALILYEKGFKLKPFWQ